MQIIAAIVTVLGLTDLTCCSPQQYCSALWHVGYAMEANPPRLQAMVRFWVRRLWIRRG